jgi:deferrochelatase/peroxidase EfeB
MDLILTNEKKGVRVGLKFLSFQNDPRRLFFILNDSRWMRKANFGGAPGISREELLSVTFAGVFFVPAKERPFPGASIFR